MENTTIAWTTHSWNPWIGCSHALYTGADGKQHMHQGCVSCYAEADMDHRRGRVKWGPSGTRSRTSDDYWKQPLKWDRQAREARELWERESAHAGSPPPERPRVFCASLADVFEDWPGEIVDAQGRQLWRQPDGRYTTGGGILREGTPATMDDLRRDLFALIGRTPNLDWLLLTKRPENVRRMWTWSKVEGHVSQNEGDGYQHDYRPNVWLGASASDQPSLDAVLPPLLACRDLCPVLFLSLEPLLGPILLPASMREHLPCPNGLPGCEVLHLGKSLIDWVIVGGESGKDARECWVDHVRSLIRQCRDAEIACFVKQDSGPRNAGASSRRCLVHQGVSSCIVTVKKKERIRSATGNARRWQSTGRKRLA
jgi:protein gp37